MAVPLETHHRCHHLRYPCRLRIPTRVRLRAAVLRHSSWLLGPLCSTLSANLDNQPSPYFPRHNPSRQQPCHLVSARVFPSPRPVRLYLLRYCAGRSCPLRPWLLQKVGKSYNMAILKMIRTVLSASAQVQYHPRQMSRILGRTRQQRMGLSLSTSLITMSSLQLQLGLHWVVSLSLTWHIRMMSSE